MRRPCRVFLGTLYIDINSSEIFDMCFAHDISSMRYVASRREEGICIISKFVKQIISNLRSKYIELPKGNISTKHSFLKRKNGATAPFIYCKNNHLPIWLHWYQYIPIFCHNRLSRGLCGREKMLETNVVQSNLLFCYLS